MDENSIAILKEPTFVGGILRLFMGPALDGIQYRAYQGAEAYCAKCNKNFKVMRNFTQVINKPTSEWVPVPVKNVK